MPLDWLTRLDPLRRIRCPFCFEKFAACEMHLRCDDHYCKSDFGRMIDDPARLFYVGVQWHPKRSEGPFNLDLIKRFVEVCARSRAHAYLPKLPDL